MVTPPRPEALDAVLREVGPLWQRDIRAGGDRIKAAYLPWLTSRLDDRIERLADLPYGSHPRQVLDVYRPGGADRAPVVMFVHGGAFVRGEKDINAAMYGNVLRWFAGRGCVGVNVEYRCAPEAMYPHGALDVAAACAWVRAHIQALGGDPGRVCLIGHSAGGTHCATYACDPALAHLPRDFACLVLASARLQADVRPENPNAGGVRAYYGEDTSCYAAVAPMAHAALLDRPVFVLHAEYENPLLDLYAQEFGQRVAAAARVSLRQLRVLDHNHVSLMAHFGSGEDGLGEQILDFFESTGRRAAR